MGYQSETPSARQTASPQELIRALNRPVDATAISINAYATRAGDLLHLTETFDISGLDLQFDQGFWKGRTEIVARFLASDGNWVGNAVSGMLTLRLRPAIYESAALHGLPYRNELTIPPKAVALKLLIGSLASGKIGTLTIPLSAIPADESNAK